MSRESSPLDIQGKKGSRSKRFGEDVCVEQAFPTLTGKRLSSEIPRRRLTVQIEAKSQESG